MALKFHDAEKRVMIQAGISKDLIRKWEAGKTPGKKNALIVARVTGRNIVDVLYGRNPVKGKTTSPVVAA